MCLLCASRDSTKITICQKKYNLIAILTCVRTLETDLNSVYLEIFEEIRSSTIAPRAYKSLGLRSKLNLRVSS